MPYNKLLEISKEPQFLFGEKFGSDINRTAKSKQKSKEVFSANDKQQPFRRGPYWDTNKIKVRSRMSRWCSPKVTHTRRTTHQYKYRPQFQGYRDKTLSLKSGTTKQNFLSYP